jgi:hypothetical protein
MIESYKEQSLMLGWIDDPRIANSLDAKRNAAQGSLQQGDNNTARNQLNTLLIEVEAQAGKHSKGEAIALLKFNTQYLISKIPQWLGQEALGGQRRFFCCTAAVLGL